MYQITKFFRIKEINNMKPFSEPLLALSQDKEILHTSYQRSKTSGKWKTVPPWKSWRVYSCY